MCRKICITIYYHVLKLSSLRQVKKMAVGVFSLIFASLILTFIQSSSSDGNYGNRYEMVHNMVKMGKKAKNIWSVKRFQLVTATTIMIIVCHMRTVTVIYHIVIVVYHIVTVVCDIVTVICDIVTVHLKRVIITKNSFQEIPAEYSDYFTRDEDIASQQDSCKRRSSGSRRWLRDCCLRTHKDCSSINLWIFGSIVNPVLLHSENVPISILFQILYFILFSNF